MPKAKKVKELELKNENQLDDFLRCFLVEVADVPYRLTDSIYNSFKNGRANIIVRANLFLAPGESARTVCIWRKEDGTYTVRIHTHKDGATETKEFDTNNIRAAIAWEICRQWQAAWDAIDKINEFLHDYKGYLVSEGLWEPEEGKEEEE